MCIFSDIMKFMSLQEIICKLMLVNKAVRKEIQSQNYIMFKKFINEYTLNKRISRSDMIVNRDVFSLIRSNFDASLH
jgi:hypothetical protein